jgi:hypothetical protein
VPKVEIAAPRIGNGAVRIRLYAGNSEYPALLAASCGSENATGADNQQGSPRDPSETIRRTSDVSDDEMVRTAWRHAGEHGAEQGVLPLSSLSNVLSEIPCRVSSDLHEWRNDLNAVSTRGSVKLQSR